MRERPHGDLTPDPVSIWAIAERQEVRSRHWREARPAPVVTSAHNPTGPFFTVVTELEVENFATWERISGEAMKLPWMGEWFSRMMPRVESGNREFYTIVEASPR